jgi:DMSO/TMAO reductase YedYZ molybdopterin-dependent catalytic subunit
MSETEMSGDDDTPRLPPGQHLTEDFPVLHVGGVPRFDPARWDLRIEGEVREAKRLTYQELRALPSVIDVSDFHCVTTWSMFDAAWEGVRFSDVSDLVGPTERARFVTIGCDGGYTTSLPIDDMMRPDVLLAWGMNGKELSPEHGFPLRLIVPHKYAYKAAKWVRWVRFTYEQELGYWEQRGYSNSADPWKEERHA